MQLSHLSFSHIAWNPEDEERMLAELRLMGVTQVELAPNRAFGNPIFAKEAEVANKAQWYRDRGFVIGSFQALLFGSEGLALFESQSARQSLKEWLLAVSRVAGWCGAGPMVFGSPKNRLKGDLSYQQAMEIAVPFFREVGDACAQAGSCLVMEANPEAYGADFCTRLEQAAELVASVDSAGFRLHVDAGGLALSGEDFAPVLRQSAALLVHAHASQPNLSDWKEPDPVHVKLAKVLQEIHYEGAIAIEMRMQEQIEESVNQALAAVRSIYRVVE